MLCNGCNVELTPEAGYLACNLCDGKYHHDCLNISLQQFLALTHDYKSCWKCPSCSNITRRTRHNLDTPISSTQLPTYEDSSMNMSCDLLEQRAPSPRTPPMYVPSAARDGDTSALVTQDNLIRTLTQELNRTLQGWRYDMDRTLDSFKEDIKTTMQDWRGEIEASMLSFQETVRRSLLDMKQELSTVRTVQAEFKQDVKLMAEDISGLKESLQFHASEQDDLKRRVDNIARHQAEQSATSTSYLESKIDTLEQQARACNLEICNVPDRRGENLLQILASIGESIGFTIPQKEVISVHRVPHAHQQNNRPKNIIVKFSTRILRDNVLSAYRKVKSLKTDQIGVSGSSTNVYMNEHLTLRNKVLFRKCKEAAKLYQYKYVWVKNCTILVRKKDGEAAFAIRSDDDISKLKCIENSAMDNTSL